MVHPHLYGALAAAIVQHAVDRFEHPQPPRTARPGTPEPLRAIAGTRFSDHALNAFERACALLFRLGLALPTDRSGNVIEGDPNPCRYGSFRMAVDGGKAAALVTERASKDFDLPPIDEMLAIWLDCATHFRLVSTRREPFLPDDDVQDVMRELVQAGYATQHGGHLEWTDSIACVMRSTYYWDANNRSFEAMHEAEAETDLREAAQTAPEAVRRAALDGDVVTVYVALCNLWVDGAWKANLEPSAPVEMFGGFDRAERFMELVAEHATRK